MYITKNKSNPLNHEHEETMPLILNTNTRFWNVTMKQTNFRHNPIHETSNAHIESCTIKEKT